MEVKRISTTSQNTVSGSQRPVDFESFVGQEPIKAVLRTAIESAKLRAGELGHILFSWSSGFGKTTLAGILSKQMGSSLKVVTWYALSKPSELVSVLNSLDVGDVLFIDEIHRLKPTIEEVLYIAMEDFLIDMVMPEGWSLRLPINPFTLIGATTKPESLSQPMKNRFIYQFHFMDYTPDEKKRILDQYLAFYGVKYEQNLITDISKKVAPVPREIHNLAVKIRDYLVSKKIKILTSNDRADFLAHTQIQDGGMMPIHSKYLEILETTDRPLGLKSLAIQLWVSEKTLEEDIEPLLLKLWKIAKTTKGRILA